LRTRKGKIKARTRTEKRAPSKADAKPAAGPVTLLTGSSAPGTAMRTLEQSIGIQIRHFRKQLGLTVAELAGTAGLSTGMLSKIENGQISPSLTTLQALAKRLNLPMTSLFRAFEEKRDCSFVASGQGVVIERRGTKVGHQYRLLGHSLAGDLVVEPYLITLTEDAVPYTAFQHEGVEFIYMLSGEVIYAHADRSYRLRAGDAMLFDSSAPHGPMELVSKPMTYLSIITFLRGET
jgi:transcriptional regulator with XRE-family HTH domain